MLKERRMPARLLRALLWTLVLLIGLFIASAYADQGKKEGKPCVAGKTCDDPRPPPGHQKKDEPPPTGWGKDGKKQK